MELGGVVRLVRAVGSVAVLVIVPALGGHQRLWSWQLLLVGAVYLVLDLSQPSWKAKRDGQLADMRSFAVIMLAAIPCHLLPIIEWAHFGSHLSHLSFAVLGSAMICAGAALRIWAIQTLGRFFSARVELQDEHRLVREGPYRWIRHPSYTGALLFLFGVPVMLQTPLSLVCCVLLMLGAYAYRIPREEQALAQHFGPAFERYQTATKRLIPYVW